MKLTGDRQINASRETVFAALNNPDILRQSIPGCEEINIKSETEMDAKVAMKIGPVKARFSGNVELNNLNPPESYTLVGKGSGGASGFAKGSASIRLVAEGAGTLLSYDVQADVGGKLAQLGGRILEGTARKLSDQFFDSFCALVASPDEPAPNRMQAEPDAPQETKGFPLRLLLLGVLAVAVGYGFFLYR